MADEIPGSEQKKSEKPETVLRVRDDKAVTTYANMFLLASAPEEVVLSFGQNFQPLAKDRPVEIPIASRVVMTYKSAKRLAITLSQLIQRYESVHGVLELEAPAKPGSDGRQKNLQ